MHELLNKALFYSILQLKQLFAFPEQVSQVGIQVKH